MFLIRPIKEFILNKKHIFQCLISVCLWISHKYIHTLTLLSSWQHTVTLKMWNKWSTFLTEMRVCCVPHLTHHTQSFSHPVSLNTLLSVHCAAVSSSETCGFITVKIDLRLWVCLHPFSFLPSLQLLPKASGVTGNQRPQKQIYT